MFEEAAPPVFGSIEKWRGVERGATEHGGADCPLCGFSGINCDACPINQMTTIWTVTHEVVIVTRNGSWCMQTPYRGWVQGCYPYLLSNSKGRVQAAHNELHFLEDLYDQLYFTNHIGGIL